MGRTVVHRIVSLSIIFVCLNLIRIVFVSWEHIHCFSTENKSDGNEQIPVHVTNIHTDVDGNGVSLKDKSALFHGGEQTNNTEATNNPFPQYVNILLNNPDKCNSSHLKYIIYIHTSPDHFERRTLLRNTWASRDLFNDRITETVFLMGLVDNPDIQERVLNESAKYRDIIQGDFADTYRNLTLKGIMALRWISTYCKQAKFVIKTDDDAFVNIFRLRHFLEENEGKERLMACNIWQANDMPILRDPKTCRKWCATFKEFPGRTSYPQFCSGLAFVFSSQLAASMYEVSKTTPFFWVDDVYITGLLLNKVKDVEYITLGQNITFNRGVAI